MLMVLLRRVFFFGALALASIMPVAAQETAPHATMKLLPAGKAEGDYLVGLEIRLKPDWVTYWKTPGEGGLPARISTEGSQNVAGVSVQWPAPTRFDKGGHVFYGYKDYVVLPVLVKAANTDEPVALKLTMDYAVCNLQCVPVQAAFPLQDLPPSSESFAATLVKGALQRIPRRMTLQEAKTQSPALHPASMTLSQYEDKPALLVTVQAEEALNIQDIFLHDADGHFAPLQPVDGQPNTFYAPVHSVPAPEVLRNLSLTVRSKQRVIEVTGLLP